MSDLISRQAAIDAMCELMCHWFGCNPKDEIKEIKQELDKLPAAQPKFPENWWKTNHGYMWLCPHCGLPVHSDFEECLRCGIKRPSAQPERKKGKWLDPSREGVLSYSYAYAECSECGKKIFLGRMMNFCPNCGANMRGEKNE